MDDYRYLQASNGSGPAVLAHIQTARSIGATTIDIDTSENWPTHFIVTTGTLLASGFLDASTTQEMKCHLDAGNVIIDYFCPGSTDAGNTDTEVAIIKPAADWVDTLIRLLRTSFDDDGTMKNSAVREALGLGNTSVSGWEIEPELPDTITYNGNRNYTLVFNSTDLTDTLSEGMRLRLQRTVSAPTTAFSLDGTNDFYNDTSVSGMAFTDDFVAGAWVYMTGYQSGHIISRYNGTSGWYFGVNATGQVIMYGHNGSASNFRGVQSYQSIPLNKWVHIAAQLDMSAHTATSTTSYVMIDGVDVPSQVAQGGTNPTLLAQAGNLEIGSSNAGTTLFKGYVDQAFVTSAKMTQTNVRTIIPQAWTAALISTHSVVSAYSNGSTSDLNTTNANNLTAQNGATTVTSSPFGNYLGGTLEYGIVASKPTFSTNTTVVVQVPEGCAIPTSGGISAVAYSTNDVPYGFPRDEGQWKVTSIYQARTTRSAPASLTVYNLGEQITIPIGKWRTGYEVTTWAAAGSGTIQVRNDLNQSSATYTATSDFASTPIYTSSATEVGSTVKKEGHLQLSAQTIYYLNARTDFTGASGTLSHLHDFNRGIIYATPAYL